MNLATPTLLLLLLGAKTTWDEPWQEEVVKGADAFLEVEVLKSEDHGAKITARCIEHWGGKLPG